MAGEGAEGVAAVTYEDLLWLADNFPPPPEWFEEDTEGLFA